MESRADGGSATTLLKKKRETPRITPLWMWEAMTEPPSARWGVGGLGSWDGIAVVCEGLGSSVWTPLGVLLGVCAKAACLACSRPTLTLCVSRSLESFFNFVYMYVSSMLVQSSE